PPTLTPPSSLGGPGGGGGPGARGGAAAPTAARVPYFWSDQYDVKIQALGTPAATDDVDVAVDDGRKFLAYYSRAGRLSGVVGAGATAQVMKTRAKIAAGAPVSELLTPS
uniref:oxidoreductase C-terminal domain-containing protein n=1 Tax=Nocardia brasiliensis TaxID=37326 RepID=UPI002453FD7F